ncbi:MAG: DUF421 domain-containing protein [Acidobacteriota bacterium]|nr:DUF421 domain-containing protein [Blastocatellia bacterium]MDW8241499.1 DUF421 domain-containing protein [Acidobacteriota bacterium]
MTNDNMWNFNHTLLEIALRTTIIYVVVLLGIRLTGKREVGQMTPFDLVLLLLLANAVQNAMTGPDTSVTGGLVAAVTLLAVNAVVTRMVWRYKKVRRLVEGTPTLLIHQGKILSENLAKERVTEETLRQALREHGIASVTEVALAVLEVDGSISVLKNDEMPAISHPYHRIRFLKRKSS